MDYYLRSPFGPVDVFDLILDPRFPIYKRTQIWTSRAQWVDVSKIWKLPSNWKTSSDML